MERETKEEEEDDEELRDRGGGLEYSTYIYNEAIKQSSKARQKATLACN
jgi:hypothetical protein